MRSRGIIWPRRAKEISTISLVTSRDKPSSHTNANRAIAKKPTSSRSLTLSKKCSLPWATFSTLSTRRMAATWWCRTHSLTIKACATATSKSKASTLISKTRPSFKSTIVVTSLRNLLTTFRTTTRCRMSQCGPASSYNSSRKKKTCIGTRTCSMQWLPFSTRIIE